MNASSLECSSGCDSGWTHYFQTSSSSDADGDDENNSMLLFGVPGNGKKGGFDNEEEEEEDLSMVSDASSGPLVYYEASCRWSTSPNARKDNKRKKMMNKQQGQGRDLRSTLLDDTASSPAVINNHNEWKGGADTIPEERRSAYQEQHHLGFLHSHNNITAATGGHDNQLGVLGGGGT